MSKLVNVKMIISVVLTAEAAEEVAVGVLKKTVKKSKKINFTNLLKFSTSILNTFTV